MTEAPLSGPPILIVGGGTGGHIYPGLAVAEVLRHRFRRTVVFVGAHRGLERRIVPQQGYPLELLDVIPMKGGGLGRMLRGGLRAGRETLQAFALVRRLAPSAVLSIGGYAAGPVSLAAVLQGVPLALLEPNAVAGFTTQLLAPWASRLFVGEEPPRLRGARVPAERLGVPVRPGFVPHPYTPKASLRVLVLGGSQGAAPLNAHLPEAFARVKTHLQELSIVHQTGKAHVEAVRTRYAELGVEARVVPFLGEIAQEIAAADLVVARAGASTLAEILAVGRASLLIPFPLAAGDHQTRNAEALVRAGAALCLPQAEAEGNTWMGKLLPLLQNSLQRVRMAEAAQALGKPDAAEAIAQALVQMER